MSAVAPLGENPVEIFCPKCHHTVLSEVEFKSGFLTYLCSGGVCLCGFSLNCCLIPFCADRLKDATHSCPNCKTVLGVCTRL